MCLFCVKICDRMMCELERNMLNTVAITEMVEEVIRCLPEVINQQCDEARL